MDIEELQLILKLIKKAIKYLEMKNATLVDCFLQLIKLSYSIKILVRDTMSPESETAFAKLDTLDEICGVSVLLKQIKLWEVIYVNV
ncbi:hypothetical protein RhiirA4_457216 [Rhizophagus irregularis]|uniref:Uncharacterized protein n=1 Tax=Rhizophagus irregularis TaxID=588596 RepID=A0A2I1G9F5_9GLOM|nr:hypothetical protein RhiirA4_457216 [Rhizophagus irregularis]